MAMYQFSALDATGQEKRGTIEAVNQQEAVVAIQRYGLQPTQVLAINQPQTVYPTPPGVGPQVVRRSSGAVVFCLLLSILALLTSAAALVWHFLAPDPLGKGMNAYDFSTAKNTYLSELKMEQNQDFRAGIEYRHKVRGPKLKERLDSVKIEDEVTWKDYTILFISYKEDGKEKKTIESFKKDEKSKLWEHTYLSSYDVRNENAPLADRMQKWTEKPMMPPPKMP